MRRALPAAAVVGLMALSLPGRPEAGAEVALDKYRSLIQEKKALQREGLMLKREAEMASTKSPYLLLDVKNGKLEFRIRGRALKAYSFSAISHDERGHRPVDPEEIWRVLDGPLTVRMKEGGHPELVPPDPEAGRETGLLYSDPNQLRDQTGAIPVDTDAGLLGVDAPTDYYIEFEEDVLFHVRLAKDLTFRQKAADRLSEIAHSMRTGLSALWGGRDLPDKSRPRLSLYLTTDADTAKHLHYSLLPGERIFVVPPPPPPVILVASKAPAAGDREEGAR